MFATALLLGSLILFNSQKSESTRQVAEIPDIEYIDLQAEVPSNTAAASLVPSKQSSGTVLESITGKLKHPEYLNFAAHQVLIKTQIQIHLELKHLIGFQSDTYLHHRSSYDDPPLS